MKYTKEIKTALLALVAVILFIFGYSFLKGKNIFDSSRTFYAIYNEVSGLSPSSAVTINGLKVGSVTDIGFLNGTGKLLVTFNVQNDFKFSENSTAQVYGGGFIGGKSLRIIPAYEKGNMAETGDTLPSDTEEGLLELVNEQLTPLQQKVEQAVVSADSLINSLNKVLNPETRHNIASTFEDISLTVESLKGSAQSIEGILNKNSDELDNTITNLNEMSENLNSFSATLDSIELEQMLTNMENVVADLEAVTSNINSKDGTLGKLLNDPTLYNNMRQASNQLEELIQDIKLNPQRYLHFSVFGKNPGPYKEPKDSLK